MIHSLCGGGLKDNQILTVVKVKFTNNPLAQNRPYWYLTTIIGLSEGEEVLAPFGRDGQTFRAVVLRVDQAVNEQVLPMPLSKMQTITSRA